MIGSEKVKKMVHDYLDKHGDGMKRDDGPDIFINTSMHEFDMSASKGDGKDSSASVYDAPRAAENASSDKERMAALKKALEIDPDNIDARTQMIMAEKGDKAEECLSALDELIREVESTEKMQKALEEDRGKFWQILDTRPYIRLRHKHMNELIRCGMMDAAAEEGAEIIKLNRVDNLGIRYTLMHLYAFLENEKKALSLHRKYENADESEMLLPLSVLYYKKRQFDTAEEYLSRLYSSNNGTEKFFSLLADGDDLKEIFDSMGPFGYRPFTEEALAMDYTENLFLFSAVPSYFKWAYGVIESRN